MDMIGKVRRMKLRDQLSDGEICRRIALFRAGEGFFQPKSLLFHIKYERKKADGVDSNPKLSHL
jgi:hypothetical protein